MKTFIALSMLVSSIAMANPICYKALNPQNIEIKVLDSEISEKATSAAVKLDWTRSVDENGLTVYPSLALNAKSKGLQFDTVAMQLDKGDKSFGVDCDGGHVMVQESNGLLVLSTVYLAGEIKMGGEGCSEGSVSFKKLYLKKVSCSK
jgi:hypothetical protein